MNNLPEGKLQKKTGIKGKKKNIWKRNWKAISGELVAFSMLFRDLEVRDSESVHAVYI